MLLTNKEIIELNYAIKQVGSEEKNHRMFTYAITLTEENIKPNVKAIQKAGKVSTDYKTYLEQRKKIIDDHAERDEADNIIYNNIDDTVKIKDEFGSDVESKIKELSDKYSKAIEERIEQNKEFDSLLIREVEVDVEIVELEYLPEHINKIMLKSLMPMIKRK